MRIFCALVSLCYFAGESHALLWGLPQISTRRQQPRPLQTLARQQSHEHQHQNDILTDRNQNTRRREMLRIAIGLFFGTSTNVLALAPQAASARFVLDEETGDYVEVDEVDWQTAWKQRLDKASTMSQQEIFDAARGAGNRPVDGEESPASRKRRALSNCRNATARTAANAGKEKDCTARVLAGESDFILNALH